MVILLQGNVLQIFLRKWSWSIRGNPGILLDGYRALQPIVRTAEVPVKLRTRHLLNTSPKSQFARQTRCLYTINTPCPSAPCDGNACESCAVAGPYQFQYPPESKQCTILVYFWTQANYMSLMLSTAFWRPDKDKRTIHRRHDSSIAGMAKPAACPSHRRGLHGKCV
jgi:hypothetical protein